MIEIISPTLTILQSGAHMFNFLIITQNFIFAHNSHLFYIHVGTKVKNIYSSFDFLYLCKWKEREVYYSLFFFHLLVSKHT